MPAGRRIRETASPLLGIVILAAAISGPVSAAGDQRSLGAAVRADRIERLVFRLADHEFAARDAAERELRRIGPDALPVLRRSADSPDLELRTRIERLIAVLERDALERALEQLARGKAPGGPVQVPAWRTFVHQLGDGPGQRQLFVAMVRADPRLMSAVDEPGAQLQAEFERRCSDLNLRLMQRQEVTPPAAGVAALLFAATQPHCRPSAASSACINACVQQGEFLRLMNQADRAPALERLVAAWISQAASSTALQRLNVAALYELSEGIDVAREIIANRLSGSQMQDAILYIAKVGTPSDLVDLEMLLDDETEIQSHRRSDEPAFSTRVQDVALAGLLYMTREDPRAYGFTTLREHPKTVYARGTIGFESQEAREEALLRWRRYSAASLKEVKPVAELAIEGVSL